MSARRFKVGDLALVVGGLFPRLLGRVVEVVRVHPPAAIGRSFTHGGLIGRLDYDIDGDAVVELRTELGVPPQTPVSATDDCLQPLRNDDADWSAEDEADAPRLLEGCR